MVVIAATPGRTEMGLPQVAHLVGERLKDLDEGDDREVFGVHRDLVGGLAVTGAEPPGREVAVGALLSLQREQTVRQLAVEQGGIEVLVSQAQLGVGRCGRLHSVYCAIHKPDLSLINSSL